MRVSREKSEENRQAVIATAGQLFREKGFDGIGLSDLMKAAGLTHGGFYKKFASKEDLQRQSVTAALTKTRARWTHRVINAKGNPLEALVKGYLSAQHRDDPGSGCAFAALGADAARLDDAELHQVFEDEVLAYLELLEGILASDPDKETRKQAAAVLSTMVGGLLMARLAQQPDLSRMFLDASAEAAMEIGQRGCKASAAIENKEF